MSGAAGAFEYSSDLHLFGGVLLGRTRCTIGATVLADDGVDRLTVIDARQRVLFGPAGRQHSVGTDEVLCVPTHIPYRTDWDTMDVGIVNFAPELLEDTAAPHLGPGQALRFAFDLAVSPAAGEAWRRTTRLVRNVAAVNSKNRNSGLLVDELARLLSSAALTCFRNTTMSGTDVTPTRTPPESLRRAVAYIDSHLDQPIRLATIAEAARVSPRALNQTFNRHLGISPISYAHRARLDCAHHDLKDAQPGGGQTVTAIAARWGFYDLARFGVTYRRTYGQPPSHTLRRG